MSESWLSRRRESDQAERGVPADAPSDTDYFEETATTHRSLGSWAVRIVVGVAVGSWFGVVVAGFIDPAIAARTGPFLEIASRLSVPLLLLVAVCVLVMLLAGHFDGEEKGSKLSRDDAREAANQAAQAAARMADAHGQMMAQTKAYAAAADRSATALHEAVTGMAAQSDSLARTTAASVEALTALTERMNAFDEATPKIEMRLSGLTETLTCLGIELRERTAYLEARLQDAAIAAEKTRDELIVAGDSLNDRLATLREGARAAGEELTSLSELSSARIDFTLDRVKTALDATEARIDAQNAALTKLIDRSRDTIEAAGQQSLDRFAAHCHEIETMLASLDERLAAQSDKSDAWLAATAAGAEQLGAQFDALEKSAIGRTERLNTAMLELSTETRRLTDALAAGDQNGEQLIKRAEALLLVLDSGVRELDGALPGAIARVEERITAMRQRIADAGPEIESVEAVASSVAGRMEETGKLTSNHAAVLDGALARSQSALAEQMGQIEALASAITQASQSLGALSDRAGPQMVEALVRVRETADAAAKRAHDAIVDAIPAAADKLGQAGGAAMQEAVAQSVDKQLERLAQAGQEAVKAAKDAAGALDGQLRALQASSDALERRLAGSAKKIDTQDRELLTKRSGELIEILNSRAIDVSRWLGHDISQAEWSAYLKGDQGLFARRSVKLIGRSDIKAVARLYHEEPDFAEHVNRYVHDFETLLRSVLEARDGSALAVTMLSSDLGKLYVALAQASDRLRT